MERTMAASGSNREAWEGGVIVHTERQADTPSTVTPEHVFPVLDHTVSQHGRNIGRAVFNSIFPKMENLFDDRYGVQPPETVQP